MRAGHDEVCGQADEQAMLHDAGAAGQPVRQGRRVVQRAKGAIQNQVALIGVKQVAVAIAAPCHLRAERLAQTPTISVT